VSIGNDSEGLFENILKRGRTWLAFIEINDRQQEREALGKRCLLRKECGQHDKEFNEVQQCETVKECSTD
jgi:hypothetical protein